MIEHIDGNRYWLHDLDPMALRLWGEVGIRWYGLSYVVAFFLAWWLMRLYYKRGRSPLDADRLATAVTALVIGVLLGGRIGYIVLYAWGDFLRDPLLLFRIWEGGMASHGGFAGVAAALLWLAWRFELPFLRLADLIASVTPMGLALGRVANFINGELWGRITSVPWAVVFPHSAPPGTPLELISPRHPSQLYAAALEGIVPFIWLQWRFWRTGAQDRPGVLVGEFLLIYAVMRIVVEQFREPDASLILAMTRGTFYSLFLIAAGIAIIFYAQRRSPRRRIEK